MDNIGPQKNVYTLGKNNLIFYSILFYRSNGPTFLTSFVMFVCFLGFLGLKKANSQKMLIFATKFQNDWDVRGKGHRQFKF